MADLVYRRVRVAKKPVKDFVSVLIESVIVIVTMRVKYIFYGKDVLS